METLIGIILIVIGLIPLIYLAIKEDSKTFAKIMVAATCGEFLFCGLVIVFTL